MKSGEENESRDKLQVWYREIENHFELQVLTQDIDQELDLPVRRWIEIEWSDDRSSE